MHGAFDLIHVVTGNKRNHQGIHMRELQEKRNWTFSSNSDVLYRRCVRRWETSKYEVIVVKLGNNKGLYKNLTCSQDKL